jgi:hypothetical protein
MDDDWEILVGGIPTPLKNDGLRELGKLTFPTEWKVIKFHGSSHHQAAKYVDGISHFKGTKKK